MNNLTWVRECRGLVVITLILSIFFSYDLGIRSFVSPSEARYVEIPREMVETGDYITPRLNGLKYFEKPPLFYWLQAASIKAFSVNETSMRLWTLVFAVLGCLNIFIVGASLHSIAAGLVSSALLATNVLYYAHSRVIVIDIVFSTFLCGALWCFFAAFVQKNKHTKHRGKIITSMYALSAFACLTKGLIGVVLPGLVAFLWIAITKNWKKIPKMIYLPGIFAFLCIFLPWHLMVEYRNPGFSHFYFVVEHFLRYTTKMHDRYQSTWFFLPVLLAGLMPWTGFVLASIKNAWTDIRTRTNLYSENIFLFCWIFGILIFFSFSNSKLIPYILPVIQPLALITGISIVKSLESNKNDFNRAAWVNVAVGTVVMVGCLIIAATSFIPAMLRNSGASLLLTALACIFAISIIVLLAAIYEKYFKISPTNALLIFVFLAANMMWTLNKISLHYQDVLKPSTKAMASFIRLNKAAEDLVFCYGYYYQDLPVYLGSTIGIVNFVGELEFGANAEKGKKTTWTESEFWNLWNTTTKRIFLLLSRETYRKVFATKVGMHNILNFDRHFIVISNR